MDRHRSHYSDAIVFSDLFVSNALVYSSPDLGAFNFGALIEFNDADAQGDAVDERFEVAGTFRHQALAVHAGYVKSPFHDGLFGLAASYQHGSFKLAGVYQQRIDAHKLYSIALDAALNDHNKARVSLTINDADPSEVYLIAGADHVFSGHFLAFAELFRRSSDVAQASDESALVFGFRFDF
ncbi:MAG: porin [Candidatus Latescibacteria bacterium]|nr:porin [Candidatus Latescibacterota bacterium]